MITNMSTPRPADETSAMSTRADVARASPHTHSMAQEPTDASLGTRLKKAPDAQGDCKHTHTRGYLRSSRPPAIPNLEAEREMAFPTRRRPPKRIRLTLGLGLLSVCLALSGASLCSWRAVCAGRPSKKDSR